MRVKNEPIENLKPLRSQLETIKIHHNKNPKVNLLQFNYLAQQTSQEDNSKPYLRRETVTHHNMRQIKDIKDSFYKRELEKESCLPKKKVNTAFLQSSKANKR